MTSDQEDALKAAREWLGDWADGVFLRNELTPISGPSRERLDALAALIVRQRTEAVEQARLEIERKALASIPECYGKHPTTACPRCSELKSKIARLRAEGGKCLA